MGCEVLEHVMTEKSLLALRVMGVTSDLVRQGPIFYNSPRSALCFSTHTPEFLSSLLTPPAFLCESLGTCP